MSLDDDIEYAEIQCPQCGSEMMRRDCTDCEGGFRDLYEEDPLWYDEDDFEECDTCGGHGAYVWCRECGWDYLENRFINGKSELKETTEQTDASQTTA